MMKSVFQVFLVFSYAVITSKKSIFYKNGGKLYNDTLWQQFSNQRSFFAIIGWGKSQLSPNIPPVLSSCYYCYNQRYYLCTNSRSRLYIRVVSRFFDRVGHETTYASSVNKHFLLNIVTIRLTKIMNNLLEHIKICTFKVIFLC